MKNKILVLFLTLNIFFAFTQENSESILGKWKIDLNIEKILEDNMNKLETYEKMVASLSSGLIVDFFKDLQMYIVFMNENKAIFIIDSYIYEEQEITWEYTKNGEIIIDDSIENKIKITSENSVWKVFDDEIRLIEDGEVNDNIILKKAL
ncbi:MAG: hypothetical protein CMC26_06500 [Flavobacteriaceae bacterium]|nr:hypothetical protein [Flavobacteriaceae bacterium]|tara:strand:- start:793 stop:1242 length:450 start_codon:yes stop_codon:yes gene_type:complete